MYKRQPPYRRPQIGQILVRSVLDRTLFVLARAAAVAAPAGLLLWILANVDVGGASLLSHCAQALDPIGRILGLDGAILLAFILGLPANEIVVPILIMTYMAQGSLSELSLPQLQSLLLANGWTWKTAVCMVVFSLLHWPCATTLATILRETKSLKWTAAAFLVPTLCGAALCAQQVTAVGGEHIVVVKAGGAAVFHQFAHAGQAGQANYILVQVFPDLIQGL